MLLNKKKIFKDIDKLLLILTMEMGEIKNNIHSEKVKVKASTKSKIYFNYNYSGVSCWEGKEQSN